MWSLQIFVAVLCVSVAWQQVAAVVNNGQSAKIEESPNSKTDASKDKQSASKEGDSVAASTEDTGNRREAPIQLGDTYGAPLSSPASTYLPTAPVNPALPVPVYGLPDAPSNNIVYPAPPPDIPPPISLPSPSYGLPPISGTYGVPQVNNYLSSLYGPPKFDTPTLSPPKFYIPGPTKSYGPPRYQYGPPGKPIHSLKFGYKTSYKGFKKPSSSYGPPSGYYKDNYNPVKFSYNLNSLSLGGNSFGHSSFSSHSGGGVPAQYGAPNIGLDSHANLDFTGSGISSQYGVPNFGHSALGHSVSTQYGIPEDLSVAIKPQYGPPQPSSHPRPPHPGAPAPPTPPDIKYDGWQPMPGLVSRAPVPSYGVPSEEQHVVGDLSYNKDLIPPPQLDNHIDAHQSTGSVANLALDNSHATSQHGVSDSYGAPLNTVTGSGGIVSSSGDEAAGQHLPQTDNVNVAGHIGFDQGIEAIKSVQYEIFPSGTGGFNGQGHGGGGGGAIADSYGAPPVNSFSSNGPYAAAHSYNNFKGGSGFGFSSHSAHNSFNSHKSHGHKGGLSLSSSGIGLIPPSGVYGVPPSGSYGTPLYSSYSGHSHHGSSSGLKLNAPKYPILHREPIPPGLFDSIAKQASYKQGFSSHHGSGSKYIPPSVQELPKPSGGYGPPVPSSLYSLPNAHSAISFQNIDHSNVNLNIDDGISSALSSYNVPLGAVDGSYLPQTPISGHGGGDVVGLDFSQPSVTIDLTQGNYQPTANVVPDCLKQQSLPSLSYGVPSANSYTASLSTLTTNIEGAHTAASVPSPIYGAPESLPVPAAQIGYEVDERSKPLDSYGAADLDVAHSQKTSIVKENSLLEKSESESHGKTYGKNVAASFGPSSELIQSESIDLNNIPLQGVLGSYTLQIQSADGGANQVPHGQVLNDGLLQSILAAIEQPQKGGAVVTQPIIQFQKSLEQQNFATNDSLSSVVGQLTDEEIRHSTTLVKDELEKTSELGDADIQHSSPVQYIVPAPVDILKDVSSESNQNIEEKKDSEGKDEEEVTLPYLEDNGIALYFSNSQRSRKDTNKDESTEDKKLEESIVDKN